MSRFGDKKPEAPTRTANNSNAKSSLAKAGKPKEVKQ